jgi:hypothetical protein
LSTYDAYAICYRGFANSIDGQTPNDAFLNVMLKAVRTKLNNFTIKKEDLVNRGEKYTELGTLGTRSGC